MFLRVWVTGVCNEKLICFENLLKDSRTKLLIKSILYCKEFECFYEFELLEFVIEIWIDLKNSAHFKWTVEQKYYSLESKSILYYIEFER